MADGCLSNHQLSQLSYTKKTIQKGWMPVETQTFREMKAYKLVLWCFFRHAGKPARAPSISSQLNDAC
jgi:hypothetical protein